MFENVVTSRKEVTVPDPHPDLNWPPEPQPSQDQPAQDQPAQEQSSREQSSRAQCWLAEVTAGVRRVRELEASPAAPEALAAGFTHRVRGAVGSGFAGGGTLDRLEPGPDLADFTADAWARELTGLSDDELVGVLCAWRRLTSWAMAGELAAVGELARRRPGPGLSQDGHLDEEVAAALTLTGRAATRLTGLAAGLARLPGTATALRAGQIDGPRAAVIADETLALDDAAALAVEDRVLAKAPGQTTGQLRAACRRAVLAADPQAGIRRRQQAEKNARVDAWTETSGTGALAGRGLPPAEMIAADKRVDALARSLKAHGVPGTLDQLRAKVFTALLAGRPVADLLPAPARPSSSAGSDLPGTGLPAGGLAGGGLPGGGLPGAGSAESAWPGLSGSVNLTMPLTAWLGLSGQPGEVAGLGPLDAGACRDLADLLARQSANRWCITLTGPGGRAVAHGCARTGPGSPRSGPPGAGPPGAGPPGAGPPRAGPPRAGPPGGRQGGSGPPGVGPLAWLTRITICGFETGTGPCAHTRETGGYRPSAALRHLIKIRDRRCSFPGCGRQAVRCDDDHTIAYDQGGRTCECNLSPLCRQHHRAKQATGWHLTQPVPGTLTWTLPHGRSYTTTPGRYPD